MKIIAINPEIEDYLKKRGLEKKFEKQKRFFEENPFHSSLRTELLEPRKMRIWSFRVNHRYRAIFIFRERDIVEIIDVNDHYK